MSLPKLVHDVRQAQQSKRDPFLRLSEAERLSGLRKSTIYALMAKQPPEFPSCVRISPRCVAWRESDIVAWADSRAKKFAGAADQLPLDDAKGLS